MPRIAKRRPGDASRRTHRTAPGADRPPGLPGAVAPRPGPSLPPASGRLGPDPPAWLAGLGLDWYEALRVSPQAALYTPGDWATAVVVARCGMALCERPSAVMLASFMHGTDALVATLGARARAGVDLPGPDGPDPDHEHAERVMAAARARMKAADSTTPTIRC